MKIILMAVLFSVSVFASVTPAQYRAIQVEALEVMMELGADPRLNPRVLSVKVLSQLGDRVKVKFSYEEDLFGRKNCTFYYDLTSADSVPRSALCGL